MDLRDTRYELVENDGGHASATTVMSFDNSIDPYCATYFGPNITFGHVIVDGTQMLYHARDKEGNLSAGSARVELHEATMTLHWRWLTGDQSSGISHWRKISG